MKAQYHEHFQENVCRKRNYKLLHKFKFEFKLESYFKIRFTFLFKLKFLFHRVFYHRRLAFDIHPSKKVTQHGFDRLSFLIIDFYLSCLISLESPTCLFAFQIDALFICNDCFIGACVGPVNWGQCQKINVAKLDHNF